MSKGETLGDLSGYINLTHNGAVCNCGIGCLRGFHNQQGVVRKLGENKHEHNGKDDTEGLVLFKAFCLQECADNDRVAEKHDQQRKAETHAYLQGQHQDLCTVECIVPVDHSAIGLFLWVQLHLSKDKLRQGHDNGDRPNTDTSKFAVKQPLLLEVLSFGYLHDGNVAVHANAGEEQHAAEEVDLVESRHYFARTAPEIPALDGVNCPEGQRAQEEEVCHSQVQQVHVGHCFKAVAHGEVNPNHQKVTHRPKDEDDPEERWLILAAKVPDPTSVTHAGFISWPTVIIRSLLANRFLN